MAVSLLGTRRLGRATGHSWRRAAANIRKHIGSRGASSRAYRESRRRLPRSNASTRSPLICLAAIHPRTNVLCILNQSALWASTPSPRSSSLAGSTSCTRPFSRCSRRVSVFPCVRGPPPCSPDRRFAGRAAPLQSQSRERRNPPLYRCIRPPRVLHHQTENAASRIPGSPFSIHSQVFLDSS